MFTALLALILLLSYMLLPFKKEITDLECAKEYLKQYRYIENYYYVSDIESVMAEFQERYNLFIDAK